MEARWDEISLRANSIGCYFSMLAFADKKIKKALFVSPVLDMPKLICTMLAWSNHTLEELAEKGEITTEQEITHSWKYFCWAEDHPVNNWRCLTAILYAEKDNMTCRQTVDTFVQAHNAALTVLPDGEHWFHTPQQLAFLAKWEAEQIR